MKTYKLCPFCGGRGKGCPNCGGTGIKRWRAIRGMRCG